MENGVREIVARAHRQNGEARASKRNEALANKRNIDEEDVAKEVSEKEAKTLANACKSGKINVAQLRRLSEALAEQPLFADRFLEQDGFLHALTGILSGQDAPRQVAALHCLVNLAGRGHRPEQVAKAAGAYLVTLVSGTNQQLASYAAHCLGNLALADRSVVPLLLAQEALPTLLAMALAPASSLDTQDAALSALYQLTQGQSLPYDSLRSLASGCLRLLSVKPPIHLLWLTYSLTASQPLHNHFASASFLNQCLDIATYEIFQKCDSRPLVKLLTPVVRILGNLSAGPDSVAVCLCLLRHPDFPAILTALLSTNYLHLCREALWLLANIVNNESVTVQEEFVSQDLMDRLETHAVAAVSRLDPYALG